MNLRAPEPGPEKKQRSCDALTAYCGFVHMSHERPHASQERTPASAPQMRMQWHGPMRRQTFNLTAIPPALISFVFILNGLINILVNPMKNYMTVAAGISWPLLP